jgi:hypothetical protein
MFIHKTGKRGSSLSSFGIDAEKYYFELSFFGGNYICF